MLKSSINSEIRNSIGTGPSNRVRNSGHIPGVVYGHNIKPKTIELDKNELNTIIRRYGTNVLVDLEVDGEVITSMIKELQRDPIYKEIIHIDFQSVSFDKSVQVTVPINLVDKELVENVQAAIQHGLREVQIECLPQNLPENIEVSVKDLAFGNPVKVRDIEFSKEVTVLNELDEIIASLTKAGKIDDEEVEERLITENDYEPSEENIDEDMKNNP